MDVAEVAAHARTENFPIASLLFPREYRPHLRAIYGFARLVDLLGDDWEGDRLEVLDELERQLDLCYSGEPDWPVMRELQPTIRACSLPREPFFRLIECNRQDQRVSDYETWADVKQYCTLSADPVGRLVLGVLGRGEDAQLVGWSDDVCTGLQLVNFLQDVPRDFAMGRIYMPAEDRRRFDVTELDRPNEPLRRLLEFEAERARALLAPGARLRDAIGGRVGRAVGCSRAAAWRRWTRSRMRAGTSSRSGPVPPGHGSPARRWWRSFDDRHRGAGVRAGRAAHARAGAQLLLGHPTAAEAEAARDRGDLRVRAGGRRHRGRSGAAAGRAA